MNKFIRVNMTTKEVTTSDTPEKYAGLAGRALTSNFVNDEVKPTCHPLGKNNKLIFAPGFLSGTNAAQSGRISVGAKSPLTGTIKESNSGGSFSQKLAKMGIKALVIEGMPAEDKFFIIKVDMKGIIIEEAPPEILGGCGNYEAIKVLNEKYGAKVGIALAGPAGEYRLPTANISFKDPESNIRSAGRGGLGAVLGSKKVKAIIVDDTGAPGVTIAKPEEFKAAAKAFAKALLSHPVTGQALPAYGTDVLVNILNEAGGLPAKNFTAGRIDWNDKISGETMNATISERGGDGKVSHGCHAGCIIRCSQWYPDKNGKYITSGFEYETVWALGADAGIQDLDDIAYLDRAMDDVGVDSIDVSVAIATAIEGGLLPWGDGKAALDAVKQIATPTPLGRIIGGGAAIVGKVCGLFRTPVVKDQAIPAYDPRAVKGVGLTYATTPMGADHTSGYSVATNILKVGGYVDPLQKEGQIELSRNLQIATAAVDSTGMCLFIAFAILDIPEGFNALVDMINARYDLALTADDVTALGKSVLKAERAFNAAAGFTNAHDRLPEFFEYEPCPPHNAVWDFTPEEIDEVFNF
ncbi:aldehyde ferredoxin oxidoreductase C-terminal domain-containing protein [Sporomusa acidovorans]|uniref:Aldehyde ferredoxin oxidoreductase N-terminal domain-containing protein n=1 Tax=Sporomusa acidovorans (strain ATCC 49682 / DSM 3132 / Mol) TaxID=1123286 RepID=A0ABZ3IXJ2_SPOA4|nr:aldehyde ferredoxin oxidoreductase C-terminal domain-containing protein [Sporomusa acidovorans]OZC23345.1 putative oxidoreductase YdhV [Sporomusa acidovorans DSM 3132]SDE42545.1 aldehyde:ferredoxin oxidoreductase [Sporomusa acidovorans]